MKQLLKLCAVAGFALMCVACNKPARVAVGGASLKEPDKVAYIQEGNLHFRGMDGLYMDLKDTPNPFANVVYVLNQGPHEVFAMNIQSGHVAMPENLRCYKIKADLKGGVEYLLAEEKETKTAYLKRKDTGEKVATAETYRDQSAYSGGCQWVKRK